MEHEDRQRDPDGHHEDAQSPRRTEPESWCPGTRLREQSDPDTDPRQTRYQAQHGAETDGAENHEVVVSGRDIQI